MNKLKIWNILENKTDNKITRVFNNAMILIISLNIIAFILETENDFYENYKLYFYWFEIISIGIFTIEYVLRIYTCIVENKYKVKFGRIYYFFTPMALIDLLVIAPFFVSLFVADSRILRLLRLLRILRLLEGFRYSKSLNKLIKVIETRSNDLISSIFLLLCLLIITSTGIYFTESNAQPDKFGSILSSMWWSVATLTTVGYGDVYPITSLGKFFGSLPAIFGVGLFAIPTGILASGFVEHKGDYTSKCPHCGETIVN
ncbi:MAG: ion transporter [bacterium]